MHLYFNYSRKKRPLATKIKNNETLYSAKSSFNLSYKKKIAANQTFTAIFNANFSMEKSILSRNL